MGRGVPGSESMKGPVRKNQGNQLAEPRYDNHECFH